MSLPQLACRIKTRSELVLSHSRLPRCPAHTFGSVALPGTAVSSWRMFTWSLCAREAVNIFNVGGDTELARV
jgi:hypothetical protein